MWVIICKMWGNVTCTKHEHNAFPTEKLPEMELEISWVVLPLVRMKLSNCLSVVVFVFQIWTTSCKLHFKFLMCHFLCVSLRLCLSECTMGMWLLSFCASSNRLQWLWRMKYEAQPTQLIETEDIHGRS